MSDRNGEDHEVWKKMLSEGWRWDPAISVGFGDFAVYVSPDEKRLRVYCYEKPVRDTIICESERGSMPFDRDYRTN